MGTQTETKTTEFFKEKRTTEPLLIDPRLILANPNNPRECYDEMEELKGSIKENGVLIPISVYREEGVKPDGTPYNYVLKNGERRLRSVLELIKEGVEIKAIKAFVTKKPSDSELLVEMLITNQGKPFTQLELATAYKRFLNYGWSITEIANKFGKQTSYVSSTITLLNIPDEIKKEIKKDNITLGTVKAIQKVVGNESEFIEEVQKAVSTAKENGSNKKATIKNVSETIKNKKDKTEINETKVFSTILMKLLSHVPTNEGNEFCDSLHEIVNEISTLDTSFEEVALKYLVKNKI